MGRRLAVLLAETGFSQIRLDARDECHAGAGRIAAYLAAQLDRAGAALHAATFRAWAEEPGALFAQAWVSATGRRA